ncbi:MAG: ethanolamine-phosphate cytidylyltransferase/choline-phosphate cytidylyltransferase [Chloroflexi bacterium]|jgi:cytidyltransferase-like protein|nr:MAG: ethanolamine-phosphate cytidylyltransferase/choline-phosphate cytidylyltransferase [Chloroflexota bacterium]
MTRVYVDMVADLFHYGHANFLKQARQFGDHLLVGIHSDKVVEGYKRSPIMTMQERIDTVSSCRYVDEVIPDAPFIIDQKWIDTHNIDLVVHGDDFLEDMTQLCYKIPIDLGIFRLVSYTPGVSTSEIIKRIRTHADN